MLILGKAGVSEERARKWAAAHGATRTFVGLARVYWRDAPARGGVCPEVAYAQAAHETAFGRFGGVIDATYRNPCGLKKAGGGGNHDPAAHKRFKSWEEGVRAHLDHLALYAGAKGYPRKDTPDPRHFPTIRGTAKTVEALGGKWAPSPTYGMRVAALIQSMGKEKSVTTETVVRPRKRPGWARDLPKIIYRDSPNQSMRPPWWRGGIEVVICHTPEGGYAGTVKYLQGRGSAVSYHVLLNEAGTEATQFVPWGRKAWHAKDDNSRSEGLSAAGYAASFRPLSEQGRVFARIVAFRLKERSLPAKWTRGKRGVKGFCRHADVQSDRRDPMSLAKWAVFVYMVKREYRRGQFRDSWGVT